MKILLKVLDNSTKYQCSGLPGVPDDSPNNDDC